MNFTGEDVARLLDDCSRMLEYAANNGIEIQPPVAEKIAAAREAFACGNWTPKLEGELYAAKAVLAAAIKPVTPETLASDTIRQAQEMMHFYYKMTLALVVFVVPISMVVFVDSDLSKNGKDLIEKNDKLALTIHNGLQHFEKTITDAPTPSTAAASSKATDPTPALTAAASCPSAASDAAWTRAVLGSAQDSDVLQLKENLQEFARNNRQLYAESRWLISLTSGGRGDDNVYESPWMVSGAKQREHLELTLPLLNKRDDGMEKLAVYQDIRAMAQNSERTSDILWGAVTTYILPVCYALLGALASILRELTRQNAQTTFNPKYQRFANRARLITAGIVGTVIGLFGSLFKSPVAAVSPLAVAFLAGYATDAFFSFLDRSSSEK